MQEYIYVIEYTWYNKDKQLEQIFSPCISIKLPTLVDAENKIDIPTGAVCLIKYTFIVLLSCPQAFLNTQIKVRLEKKPLVSHSKFLWNQIFQISYLSKRLQYKVPFREILLQDT